MRNTILCLCVIAAFAGGLLFSVTERSALAHCEVPCGVYDDHARVRAMYEDTTTIAKAVDQIRALAGKNDALSLNQATRWVATKEQHATHIQTTMAQYFLTQRVKAPQAATPAYDEYLRKLAQHHAVMVAAMKTKQTVDPDAVLALRTAIDAIAPYYRPAEGEHAAADHTHDAGQHAAHTHDHGDGDHHHHHAGDHAHPHDHSHDHGDHAGH